MNDPRFHSIPRASLKWNSVLREGWPVVLLLRPSIRLLENYSTMHFKADTKGSDKLREKSRANWLSRDTTHCLRQWQVHGPELEKQQVLKGKGQRDGQSPQPRAEAPARLFPGVSRAYIYITQHLCRIFWVCNSPWRSKRSQRDTWNH